MSNFNSCIFVEKEHCHRLAHNIASTDDNSFFARYINTC